LVSDFIVCTFVIDVDGATRESLTGKDAYGVNAEATIKRSDFGMTAYLPAIADSVKLQITVEAEAN